MKNFERETFKDCLYTFWVFFWAWAVASGFLTLLLSIMMTIFSFKIEGSSDDISFQIWKWCFLSGLGSFSLFIVLIYLKGLFGLVKYKKEAIVYAEEKELKEFISHCKNKKS